MSDKEKILVLCSGNSCRSQMAEAFFEKYAGDAYEVFSAGLDPRPIHPLTIQVMKEAGVDISNKHSKSLREYLGRETFSHVIFVCGEMEQKCPHLFPISKWRNLSWPFPDPAMVDGDDSEKLEAFRNVRDRIEVKIRQWLEEQRSEEKQGECKCPKN